MKRRIMRILAVLMLALYLLCTACGGTGETVSPQDDPNEGLGGGFDEDAVNDFNEFEGTWLGEANNDYDHIDIDADGNWTLWYGEDVADYGYLRYEPEWGGVYAYSNVDDSGGRLVVQDDGRLYSTVFGYFNYGDGMEYIWYENGGLLLPVEEIMSTEPYFSRCGLEINAEMDMGSYLLENGVCCYSGLGDGYSTGDCCWEVIKGYDYTHDGIRELQFDAVCYIPGSSIPYYEQQYITNTNSELYDAYTGMWLTTATTYDNSERGDNYYVHTVDWNGSSYMIEFAYSNDWQYYVGDWAMVFTKSYVVYMPENYDGLVLAAEPQPDNYRDTAKRMKLDSISPEGLITELDTLDPYACLYFSVCC